MSLHRTVVYYKVFKNDFTIRIRHDTYTHDISRAIVYVRKFTAVSYKLRKEDNVTMP